MVSSEEHPKNVNRGMQLDIFRWVHDLEPNLTTDDKDKWTDSEEKLMFKYHGEFGNKWAKIAQKLNGK